MRNTLGFLSNQIIWVLIFSTHLISFSIGAQHAKIDSLLAEIKKETSDSTRVNLLNELGLEYLMEEAFDDALKYCNQALETSEAIDFKKGEAYSLKNIGLIKYYQGEYSSVFDYWTRSL